MTGELAAHSELSRRTKHVSQLDSCCGLRVRKSRNCRQGYTAPAVTAALVTTPIPSAATLSAVYP
jgi:hypothetical protein